MNDLHDFAGHFSEPAFPQHLCDLFYFPDVGGMLEELAEKAESESWRYDNGGAHANETEGEADSAAQQNMPILHSYLRYTYRRLVEEGKIAVSADGQSIAFNTGLVTPIQQEIFAFGVPNRREDARQKWFFVG